MRFPHHLPAKSDSYAAALTILEAANLKNLYSIYNKETRTIDTSILKAYINEARHRYSEGFVDRLQRMLISEENDRDTFGMSLGHPPTGIAHIDEQRKAIDAEEILEQAKQNAVDIQEDMLSVDYSDQGDRANFIEEQEKAQAAITSLKKSVHFKKQEEPESVYAEAPAVVPTRISHAALKKSWHE